VGSVIVTGVSGGLGLSIVEELLRSTSHEIVGIGRRRPRNFSSAISSEQAAKFSFVEFDLRQSEGIDELYKSELRQKGPLVSLINNAGESYDTLVVDSSYEPMDNMFRTNVFSAIFLSKYVLRDMLLHETKGSLVHITSVSAHTGNKGLSLYGATKGAMEAFSLGLSREYGGRGIRSNCIAAGFMETAMTQKLSDSARQRIYKRTSLGQPTSPESVAKTVNFLISSSASSITGATVRVDSGTI